MSDNAKFMENLKRFLYWIFWNASGESLREARRKRKPRADEYIDEEEEINEQDRQPLSMGARIGNENNKNLSEKYNEARTDKEKILNLIAETMGKKNARKTGEQINRYLRSVINIATFNGVTAEEVRKNKNTFDDFQEYIKQNLSESYLFRSLAALMDLSGNNLNIKRFQFRDYVYSSPPFVLFVSQFKKIGKGAPDLTKLNKKREPEGKIKNLIILNNDAERFAGELMETITGEDFLEKSNLYKSILNGNYLTAETRKALNEIEDEKDEEEERKDEGEERKDEEEEQHKEEKPEITPTSATLSDESYEKRQKEKTAYNDAAELMGMARDILESINARELQLEEENSAREYKRQQRQRRQQQQRQRQQEQQEQQEQQTTPRKLELPQAIAKLKEINEDLENYGPEALNGKKQELEEIFRSLFSPSSDLIRLTIGGNDVFKNQNSPQFTLNDSAQLTNGDAFGDLRRMFEKIKNNYNANFSDKLNLNALPLSYNMEAGQIINKTAEPLTEAERLAESYIRKGLLRIEKQTPRTDENGIPLITPDGSPIYDRIYSFKGFPITPEDLHKLNLKIKYFELLNASRRDTRMNTPKGENVSKKEQITRARNRSDGIGGNMTKDPRAIERNNERQPKPRAEIFARRINPELLRVAFV